MTNIPYCDETWPVVTGCSKVSPGCANCWAERISHRFKQTTKPWTAKNAAENVVLHAEKLDKPLHWRRPRTVFVCATGDLFHEQVPDEFIAKVFNVMARASQHRFLILTKRPDRMRVFCSHLRFIPDLEPREQMAVSVRSTDPRPRPLPNVWLGVSAENQHWADVRIPLLLDTPAAHRWVSLEPLLGEIDLEPWLETKIPDVDWAETIGLDLVVVGGESGPKHRPMNLAWADSISEQCRAAGVPYFGKQRAARLPDQPLPGELGRRETP